MTADKNPLISVIIPVWNGAAYVGETIASVRNQGMNTEILVIDDGSTDNSREIVAACGCVPLARPHSGIANTCNAGIARTAGEYLMILDQDDVLCPGALRTLLECFLLDNSLQAVAAKAQDFISPDLDGEGRKRLRPRPAPYHGLMGAVLFRRDVPEIVGGFNASYQAGQAVDYLLRMERSGIICARLDSIAVFRRLHANNTGRTMKHTQSGDYAAILRTKLGR